MVCIVADGSVLDYPLSTLGPLFTLIDNGSRSLTEIQTLTIGIEWTTSLVAQGFQRLETTDNELRLDIGPYNYGLIVHSQFEQAHCLDLGTES